MFGQNQTTIVEIWPDIRDRMDVLIADEPDLSVTEYEECQLDCILYALKSLRAPNCSYRTSVNNFIVYSKVNLFSSSVLYCSIR